MDNGSLIPGGSSTSLFSSPPSGGGGRSPLMMMLVIVLGLGTIGFGVLTVTFSSKASNATKTLESAKTAAASKAAANQKKQDDIDNTRAAESPFRSYTSPEEFGAFVINFPKTWTSYIDEEPSGTQVYLSLNPDFLRKKNGQDGIVAAKVFFIQRTKDSYLGQFDGQVKKGKIKQSNLQVAGQPAYDLTGEFTDHKTIRQVVIPIRDKVLVFTTENSAYATEFNEILAQAKVNP